MGVPTSPVAKTTMPPTEALIQLPTEHCKMIAKGNKSLIYLQQCSSSKIMQSNKNLLGERTDHGEKIRVFTQEGKIMLLLTHPSLKSSEDRRRWPRSETYHRCG